MKNISFCGWDLWNNQELKRALEYWIKSIEPSSVLSYPDPQGLKELRDRISGIFWFWDKEVLITNSATEALFLTLSATWKSLFLQNPSYFWINRQAKELDKEVEIWESVRELEDKIIDTKNKVIYLTSNFNSIDWTSLSDVEKNKIIETVESTNSLLIEDNPSDLLYFWDKPNSLIEKSDLVLYIWTLAKILWPWLALWFIAWNSDMIKKIKSKKVTVSLRSATPSMIIANKALTQDYLPNLRSDHYNKWINFKNNLIEYWFDFIEPEGWVFTQLNIPENINLDKLIKDVNNKWVKIEDNKHYFFDWQSRSFLRLNFVKNTLEDNKKWLQILSELLKSWKYEL